MGEETPPYLIMKNLIFLLLPFSLFSQTYSFATKVMSWQGNDYYVSNQMYTFWGAENHIQSIDTNIHVLSISNSRENNELADSLNYLFGYDVYCWLGGHDTTTEGTYKWMDSTSFNYSNWYCDSLYCEPNGGTDENYIMFNFGERGKWNDATNINDYFRYLFKVPTPTSTGGSTGNGNNGGGSVGSGTGNSIGIEEYTLNYYRLWDWKGNLIYEGNDLNYQNLKGYYVLQTNGEIEKIFVKGY